MANIITKTLGEILTIAHQFESDGLGSYYLFVNCTEGKEWEYSVSELCAVIYLREEEFFSEDYHHPSAKEQHLCIASSAPLAAEIVRAAQTHKPDWDASDLVKAFSYYLINDAFYPFWKENHDES